jgi:tetratricopeptide (TPR) repeat protein
VPLPSLFINRDADYDWLIALEHGRVCDGHPPTQFRGVADDCAYMLERPGGRRVIGFVVQPLRAFVPPQRLFAAPHFEAPLFGLSRATAGEIVLAAQARLADEPTTNRAYFSAAINAATAGEAETMWRCCLESGDSMAHYGLGYTLLGQGRAREAYGHLRYYTELAPTNAWAWCWLGQACAALGERTDARAAYERAMELGETDAGELLADVF